MLIDIFKVAHSLGDDLRLALPGMHAVTGCDTVSYFKSKGKSMPWRIFIENQPRFTDAFIALSQPPLDESLSEVCLSGLEAFISRLYPYKSRIFENVTDIRECQLDPTNSLVSDEKFPPAQDCLKQHFLRARYQAFQWDHACNGYFCLPSPIGYGFEEVNSKLKVKWFTGDMLPLALHTRVSCGCKTGCKTDRCGCKKAGLSCSELCKCGESCENCAGHVTEIENEDEGEVGKNLVNPDSDADSDVDSVSSD